MQRRQIWRPYLFIRALNLHFLSALKKKKIYIRVETSMADGHLAWRNNAALPILYILFPPLIARFLSAHFTSFGVVCRLEGGKKKTSPRLIPRLNRTSEKTRAKKISTSFLAARRRNATRRSIVSARFRFSNDLLRGSAVLRPLSR